MRSRLRFWKYPIMIVLLLLIAAAFTLIYTLSDTATAPYEPVATPDPVIIEEPEPEDDPDDLEEPEPEDEPEEEPDPAFVIIYNPEEDGFITIQMDTADIHDGYLILVNHDHIFDIPDDLDLVNIAEEKTVNYRVQIDNFRLLRSLIEPLDEMMDAFLSATNNRSVAIISAFRTLDNQQRILSNYIARMGRREALRWASPPGHSEHHTGLAFDFGIMSGNNRSTFTGTGNTSWFRRNAHDFGFVLRYQQGKTQITQTAYEPWHFRYVGLPHSIIMNENNWCLEEYIEILREYTLDEPFEFEHEEITYLIYFTSDTEVKLPLYSEFEISGNNVDGFIITAVLVEFDPDDDDEEVSI